MVILASLFLLNYNQKDIDERVVQIEKSSPCVINETSKECAVQVNTLVRLISPTQSLAIICKSVDKLGVPCVNVIKAIEATDAPPYPR